MKLSLKRTPPAMIPFFGFALGAGLDSEDGWQAGLPGIRPHYATEDAPQPVPAGRAD